MAIQNLGKVVITPKGAHVQANTYNILDVVTSGGSSYLAIQSVPANTAITNTSYWQLLAVKGDTGNGIASIEKTGTSGNIDTYTITYTNGGTATFTVANSLIPDGVVAEYYDTTKSYSPGDYVLYNGGLYRCIESATGAWDSDKWESTSIGADLTLIYAKKNGYYQLMTVGYADNLTPYSSDSGTSQNTPFVLQGTGCANGEEQADTGSYCQLQRKNGNTVTVNQASKVKQAETVDIFTYTVNGDYVTCNCVSPMTLGYAVAYLSESTPLYSFIKGHKYLAISFISAYSAHTTSMYLYGIPGNEQITYAFQQVASNISSTGCYAAVLDCPANHSRACRIGFWGDAWEVGDTLTASGYCIDLTLWFGSNDKIPTHLLNHPEDFFRYYQGDLSYNVGTLTDCNGRYLKTTGRNVFDGEHDVDAIPNQTYHCYGTATIIYKDIDGNTISSESKTNTTFTTPSNCTSFSVLGSGNICISLYYDGESGYDQYYPYEELANIDTGDEPLLAFDYKTPDGTIHRDTLPKIDMGTLNWILDDRFTNAQFYAGLNYVKKSGKGICSKYPFVTGKSWGSNQDKTIGVLSDSYVICTDSSYETAAAFKTAMSGVYLEVEAETPTTEQGTPFPENVAIDDFGTMAFDCPNGVPQGNLIFYPVDYKAEIDTLHNITEGDMHKLALKGELAEGEPETIEEVVDYINARIPAPPAEDGTYNLTVTVASGEATYSWVSAT